VKQADTADQVTSSPERDAHRLRNGLLWTAGLIVLLLAIGLAVPDLREVLERVAKATPGWLVLGVLLEIASCLGYVATVRLVLHRGPPRQVRWLAWAETAFGAVVPVGGAGGLAVGAWAMRAWGIPWSRVANRSAVIFLLTSAVNTVVLALASLGVMLGLGVDTKGVAYWLVPTVVAIAALAFFLALPRAVARKAPSAREGRIGLILRRTATWVTDTEAIALQPDWRLLGTVGYLFCDMAVLWACLRAVGTRPSLLALVMGYQIGYMANVVPIPGGIGVLEGGLLGALLLYGLPAAPTAAAVVLYHAIALWIPVLGGTVGFARLRGAVTSRGTVVERLEASRSAPVAVNANSHSR
jgi:uncharacterized membrane protein YbhN (UPF0104 family)